MSSIVNPIETICPLLSDPLAGDTVEREDWYELAMQCEAVVPQPRASSWSDEEDEDPLDETDEEEEIETDPFDDFDEEDFDDDFDDDFEEELEDEYEIEPADDGALSDADLEELSGDSGEEDEEPF